jgi:hypothetical protein
MCAAQSISYEQPLNGSRIERYQLASDGSSGYQGGQIRGYENGDDRVFTSVMRDRAVEVVPHREGSIRLSHCITRSSVA